MPTRTSSSPPHPLHLAFSPPLPCAPTFSPSPPRPTFFVTAGRFDMVAVFKDVWAFPEARNALNLFLRCLQFGISIRSAPSAGPSVRKHVWLTVAKSVCLRQTSADADGLQAIHAHTLTLQPLTHTPSLLHSFTPSLLHSFTPSLSCRLMMTFDLQPGVLQSKKKLALFVKIFEKVRGRRAFSAPRVACNRAPPLPHTHHHAFPCPFPLESTDAS